MVIQYKGSSEESRDTNKQEGENRRGEDCSPFYKGAFDFVATR